MTSCVAILDAACRSPPEPHGLTGSPRVVWLPWSVAPPTVMSTKTARHPGCGASKGAHADTAYINRPDGLEEDARHQGAALLWAREQVDLLF